jgi:hypothetical protein
MAKRLLFLLLVLASVAAAQTSLLIRVQQGNNVSQVANNGTIALNSAGIGRAVNLTVTITYTGRTSLSFSQAPVILGSQDFSVSSPPPANIALQPSQSVSLGLTFLPSSGQIAQAELDYQFSEAQVQTPGQTVPPVAGQVVLGLNGTTPEYSLSYAFANDNNLLNVASGGTVSFPDTVTGTTNTAAMVLVNRGSGAGQVMSITSSGDAFSLASLPLLPSFIASGSASQFQVRYRPRSASTDTGQITITFESGQIYTVRLTGRGVASLLSYEMIPPQGDPQSISPALPVTLPATNVGEKTTVFIRLRNTSSFDVAVSNIAISGAGYTLGNLPFLPATIAPGQVQAFTITFSPTQPGQQAGRLLVGTDTFDLVGNGLGPQLTYSYRNPAGSIPVQPLGSVIFPSAQVGDSSSVQFTVENTGTAQAALVVVGIVADGTPVFTVSGLPALPVAIAPNSSVSFTVKFAPLNSSLTTASLRVNGDAFSLIGLGSTPQPLPSYTLQGPTEVQPFQQPSASLTLAAPYPVTVVGTLTLSTTSAGFVSDPAVQFITGGTVANFTIPAGTTRAVFSNGSTNIRFQTGSVAGVITMTPAFATQGGLNLTPTSPTVLNMTMAATAPVITSVAIGNRSATGFDILVTGYVTSRSLTAMSVTFTPKSGFKVPQTAFTLDLNTASFLWFSSSTSATFGGQFQITVPFTTTTTDTSSTAQLPITAIESVAITVANSIGTSATYTAQVQ